MVFYIKIHTEHIALRSHCILIRASAWLLVYVSAVCLQSQTDTHTHGRPFHTQTQTPHASQPQPRETSRNTTHTFSYILYCHLLSNTYYTFGHTLAYIQIYTYVYPVRHIACATVPYIIFSNGIRAGTDVASSLWSSSVHHIVVVCECPIDCTVPAGVLSCCCCCLHHHVALRLYIFFFNCFARCSV